MLNSQHFASRCNWFFHLWLKSPLTESVWKQITSSQVNCWCFCSAKQAKKWINGFVFNSCRSFPLSLFSYPKINDNNLIRNLHFSQEKDLIWSNSAAGRLFKVHQLVLRAGSAKDRQTDRVSVIREGEWGGKQTCQKCHYLTAPHLRRLRLPPPLTRKCYWFE